MQKPAAIAPEIAAKLPPPATHAGGARRKVIKRLPATTTGADIAAIQSVVKKIDAHPIPVEQVNLFLDDGSVIHFNKPSLQASNMANTFIINGKSQVKEITELFPGIFDQLGAAGMESLQRAAAELKKEQQDVPELIQNLSLLPSI